MTVKILEGDCREVLADLPDGSVQCCVTSPPYFGLRDYGHGDQIGLEPTVDQYVDNLVRVFREVRRVLRDDGVLWLNLGDSYASSGGVHDSGSYDGAVGRHMNGVRRYSGDLKPKDLIGIPWRVAFALQADGWVLRSDCVWHKANPMPESVRDRPTKAHEMVFLFAKAKWSGSAPGRYEHISDEDARWLALLFDTEGNIVIKRAERQDGRRQYGAQMAFANTSRALLERAQSIVGAGSILERPGTNAPMHYWQMCGREARDLLHRIYPHLIIKQRQARVAIHMQDVVAEPGRKRPGRYRTEEHAAFLERCWETIKDLNHFGQPDIDWVPEPEYGRWSDCERYFYDAEAVKEEQAESSGPRRGRADLRQKDGWADAYHGTPPKGLQHVDVDTKRNLRTVWTIATRPYSEAHFATFPPDLAERCIRAGTSERGQCPGCGTPWERVVERTPMVIERSDRGDQMGEYGRTSSSGTMTQAPTSTTTGWAPGCTCDAGDPVRQTVLDPFGGAGTTGLVADRLGRSAILVELNPEYAALARRRITGDAPMFAEVL